MLTVSSAVLGATLVAVCTAGGTYGLWADSSPISAGIVESGSLTLLVDGRASATIDSTPWSAMFPGDRVQQSVTLSNTGTVDADVVVSADSAAVAAGDYKVEVTQGACPVDSADLVAPDALTAPAAVDVWSAGQALAACIEVTLVSGASAASQGAEIPLALIFTATQKVG